MQLPRQPHPDGQDKSSLQLGGSALQSLLDCPNPWIDYEQLIILQRTYNLYLRATPNAPKSYTLQVIWAKWLNQCQCIKNEIA